MPDFIRWVQHSAANRFTFAGTDIKRLAKSFYRKAQIMTVLSNRSQFFVGATPCGCREHRG